MSLLGSISTAVTGLTAQSACLGNISDNLANTSTTGFKSVGTAFKDIVSTGATESCGPTGLGAIATPTYYNSLQGSISVCSVDTYMAISGQGFFAVTPENSDVTTANSGGTFYTRNGDFALDKDGYLKNSSGYYLMGWAVNSSNGVVQTGSIVPLQFSDLIDSGVVTSNLVFEANLPSEADVGAVMDDATTTVYDSEGNGHTVTYSWEKTDMNTWDLTTTVAGGAYDAATDTENDFTATTTFVFDTGHIQTVDSADVGVTILTNEDTLAVTGATFDLPLVFKDAQPQTITAHFDKQLTQFADTTMDVGAFAQDGAATGTFSGITINENGLTSVNYDNGVSRIYFQIPIATFNAPNALERMSGNIFTTTLESGTATYNTADTAGAGKLTVGALENSTVDIADQFTRMIQAQRAYAANAKTVSVSDTMLQTLVTI